jgi:hypothetical protein
MASLLSDPARARTMGSAAAAAAGSRFGWEPIAAAVLAGLEEVVK